MEANALLFSGLILLAIGFAGLMLLNSGILIISPPAGTPVANGEWVFRTGTDPSGQLISYAGGMMMRMSCACPAPIAMALTAMACVHRCS